MTSTTVLLDWFPNPDHIALYLAQKDGDFAKQHLNVTFQSPSNSTDALKLVSLGQVPLAISYEPETITAATDGLNVAAVAAMIPTSLNSLIISGKSGVSSPAGLSGKTVGTDGDPVSAQMLKAVLKKYNMSLNQIKLVTVNEGLVPAMVSNKVAAIISGYRNVEAIQLASLGLKPKVYPVNTQGVPNYDELVIIANKSKLASDPAYRTTVKEFLAGLGQGAAAAQASPAAALAALSPVAKGYSPALLKKMVDAIPRNWVDDKTMRTYVLLLWKELDDRRILDRLPFKPGVDELRYTPGAVVWRVDRENVGRSHMSRIVGTPLYKMITIRSANTMRKLNELTAAPTRLPAAD